MKSYSLFSSKLHAQIRAGMASVVKSNMKLRKYRGKAVIYVTLMNIVRAGFSGEAWPLVAIS